MKPDAVYSVVFPIKENKRGVITHVLTGEKTRKIFKGLRVGVGGRMDLVDTCIKECGCRETREETGRRYQKHELEEVGVILSHEPGGVVSQVYFFLARGGKGRVRETRDGAIVNLEWHESDKLPTNIPAHYTMLIPKFLTGFRVEGRIALNPERNVLIDSDLHISRKI